jgi:acyl carrier protein
MHGERAPEIQRTIIDFVAGRVPAPLAASLDEATPLLTGGTLDSLGVLELMMFLETTYGIGLDDSDFDAENLATVRHLVRFVERKRAA